MGRWRKWIGAGAAMGVTTSAVTTLVGGRSWGWDFVVLSLITSVLYTVMGPLIARSRRRAEERDRSTCGTSERHAAGADNTRLAWPV